MVTTTAESIHLIGILLRYVSKQTAYRIVSDMELEIAMATDNISLKKSIKMMRAYLE